jgi:Fungal Zn(2)-Cys(6) binuclear cluster domain
MVRKSCAACRKAKVKCNSEFPQCCRCVDKGLVCVYELTRRSENLALQLASPPLNERRSADAMLVETSKLGGQNDILWDASPSRNSQALLNSNVDQSRDLTVEAELLYQNTVFGWEPDAGGVDEFEGSDVGVNLYSNGAGNEFSHDWFSSAPLPGLTLESTLSIPADCMFHTPYLVLRPLDFDYRSQSTSLLTPRSPFIHSHLSSGSQIGRTFLLQNIQSYATLLATSSLPPFIHPVFLPPQGPSLPSSAPLEICKSIISLYASKTAATSPFIWRAITMEIDQSMKKLEDADDWTTLSMLQAITLYILLRIFDQDSFSVEFDRELVHAMTVRYPNLDNALMIAKMN